MLKKTVVVALALAGVAAPALGAGRPRAVEWFQTPVVILPGRVEPGMGDIAEDATIFTIPLRWAFSTRLDNAVTLGEGEQQTAFAAGTLMPMVEVGGTRGYAKRTAYCSRSRVAEAKEATGVLANLGVVGVLAKGAANTAKDRQVCLEDSDGNGSHDRSFVIGDGPGIIELGAIAPVPFKQLLAEPIDPGHDYVDVSLSQIGQETISFSILLNQNGRLRRFDSWKSDWFAVEPFNFLRHAGKHAEPLSLFGVGFEVVKADVANDRATLRWAPKVELNRIAPVPNEVL